MLTDSNEDAARPHVSVATPVTVSRTRSRAASAFIWLFVLGLGVVMIAGGFYMRHEAQATRAEAVREGWMDRRREYRLTRRHRDGTFSICLGVFPTGLGAFGLITVLSGRRMPREDQVAESLFFRSAD